MEKRKKKDVEVPSINVVIEEVIKEMRKTGCWDLEICDSVKHGTIVKLTYQLNAPKEKRDG